MRDDANSLRLFIGVPLSMRSLRAVANAARGRTTFLITHRLSQIRWADLIVVLRKGRIAAIGNHDELMRTSEAYSRIFKE